MASIKIYEMTTERIVTKIEDAIRNIEAGKQGIAPWKRPWFQAGIPMNLKSKKAYRGFNVFLLSSLGYVSPYFVTFRQATELHRDFDRWEKNKGRSVGVDKDGNMVCSVKKGEKACPVVFWKVFLKNKDKDGNAIDPPEKGYMLRYYSVFNVEQCEGFEEKIPELPTRVFNPIEDAEKIIKGMPNCPPIEHKEARAFYRPSTDTVNMPKHELFNSDAEYYSTAFHELVHSTGHHSRLNRDEVMDSNFFGNHAYSKEELTAEMGAVFLCNEVGIDTTFDNSLAYLKSWLGKFKNDVKMLIQASGKAQKAVDYILKVKHDYDNPEKKGEDNKINK